MRCRIEISRIELPLHVGCTEEERRRAQPIGLSASVASPEAFPATRTDELRDTVDASEIRQALIDAALSARARTLERLGQAAEDLLRRRFARTGLRWEVTIDKPGFGWAYVHSWAT